MKILYLSHCLPHPPNGAYLERAYRQLRQLAQRHEVHLLTLAGDGDSEWRAEPLRRVCAEVEVVRQTQVPTFVRGSIGPVAGDLRSAASRHSSDAVRRLRRMVAAEAFDAVVVYDAPMASLAALVDGVPKLLDLPRLNSWYWSQRTHYAGFPLRRIYQLEARRWRRFEKLLASSFDCIVLSTAHELEALRALAPEVSGAVIANGVCGESFRPLDLPRTPHPSLIFTGRMDDPANVDGITSFARSIFPRLRQQLPDLELVIVGRCPSARVQELESVPGIAVIGAVGDMCPFLARAWAYVAPMRIAGGSQSSVLEAMAASLPVVCTPRVVGGLAEGGFRHGREILVASNDEEFEGAVRRLLASAETRQRLGSRARSRVAAAYSWDANMRQFERQVVGLAGQLRRRDRVAGPAVTRGRLEAPLGRLAEEATN